MTDNKSGEILIIEDDKDINDLLATALSKAGYRTRQAWSGTEGELLLKLDREAYALVLLDLMLPGLSGEELLARIRQMDASLPVIILTAKDELDEKINLLVAGADDYITKPFEIKEVVARVAVQLRHAVADVPSKSGKAGENQTKAENDTGQGDTTNTYIAGPVKIEHRQLVLDRISRQLYVADNAVDGITKQEFAILELLMAHPRQVSSLASRSMLSGAMPRARTSPTRHMPAIRAPACGTMGSASCCAASVYTARTTCK